MSQSIQFLITGLTCMAALLMGERYKLHFCLVLQCRLALKGPFPVQYSRNCLLLKRLQTVFLQGFPPSYTHQYVQGPDED